MYFRILEQTINTSIQQTIYHQMRNQIPNKAQQTAYS
jgi:hypothetical protein